MTLYLIRHGESHSNLRGEFTGQVDSPLTELGHQQADSILSYFLGIHIDRIYSSDLQRAYDTVLPISKTHRVPITTMKELREINGGDWQQIRFVDLNDLYPDEYKVWRYDIGNSRCPKGESVREVCQRVCGAISQIAKEHEGETVVIGLHAVPIRTALTYWLTGDVSNMAQVGWVPNASVSKIEYKDGVFTPVDIGNCSHLNGEITSLSGKI